MNSSVTPSPIPWANQIAVFDTETTGLDLREARIVTACVAVLDAAGQVIGSPKEWLADPGIEIPEVASNVHGVTTEIARRDGADAKLVVSEIVATLRDLMQAGIPVVAYNAPYDFTILHFEAKRHGIEPLQNVSPVIDPLVLDKKVDRYRKGSRKLEDSAALYSVALDDAHNATADAVAAGRLALALAAKYSAELNMSVEALHEAQISWSREQEESFASFMRGKNPNFVAQYGWPIKKLD